MLQCVVAMWLAYLDETGNTGKDLKNPDQPRHMIATVLVHESKIRALHNGMRRVARRRFGGEADEPAFELHGADIYGGKGVFSDLPPQERIGLYGDVLEQLGRHEAHVIVRGVDKPRLAARYPNLYHPHDIALMFTMESVERFAGARDADGEEGCHILLVADENAENEDAALRDLARYQRAGTPWGWRSVEIDHIVDTIHFVSSRTNWGIQLTDCVAYLASRRARVVAARDRSPSALAVRQLWDDHVKPHVREYDIWRP